MSEELTRERLTELLAKLRTTGSALPIADACALIDSYGVPDSWLYQCLLYESDAAVWAAWKAGKGGAK